MEENKESEVIEVKQKWYQKKVIGIPMALFIIGLVVIGGASAGLLTYLSNTVTAKASVNSPMELKIDLQDDSDAGWVALSNGGSIDLGSKHGGEIADLYVYTHNMANVATTGTMWNVVSNPSGVTCPDFVAVGSVRGINPSFGYTTPTTLPCSPIDAWNVRLSSTPTEPYTWAAGRQDVAHITVTFASAASGTYTLTTYVKP